MSKFQRRTFLRFGLGLGAGLGLAGGTGLVSRLAQAANVQGKAMVVLFMHGGMSQIDTFDPKPGRDTGGTFRAIDTSLPGVRFSEHLPRLAARADRMTVVRSLVAREGNHVRARYLMHTGYAPQGGVQHPALGAHLFRARQQGDRLGEVPGYVSIGREAHGAGYLGPAYAPFIVRRADQPVRNLAPPATVGDVRAERRRDLVDRFDAQFSQVHGAPQSQTGTAMREQAEAIMRGPAAPAFELDREHGNAFERYGGDGFGRGCLMARRLIDADVPFVEVVLPGWDTHDDNFNRVEDLSVQLDRAMSALLDDLKASGRLSSTMVLCLTDFGRTPRINARGGRDHYPAASSALLVGGGAGVGRLVGATDPDGYTVIQRPVRVPDLFRTLAQNLGVTPDETHLTPEGRPVTTVDEDSELITELLA